MQVTLMVDGSFCPETGAGGYGYWIASYRGKRPGSGPITGTTKNPTEVEMKAVCNSLVEAVNCGLVMGGDVVLVQTDSKNTIAAFEGRRIPGEPAEQDAVSFLKRYKEERDLTLIFRHVKGHSDSRMGARFASNNHCDERAKQAMRKVRAAIKKEKRVVQTVDGTECSCAQPWRLSDLRPLRIPGADVCQVWSGVRAVERERVEQC